MAKGFKCPKCERHTLFQHWKNYERWSMFVSEDDGISRWYECSKCSFRYPLYVDVKKLIEIRKNPPKGKLECIGTVTDEKGVSKDHYLFMSPHMPCEIILIEAKKFKYCIFPDCYHCPYLLGDKTLPHTETYGI